MLNNTYYNDFFEIGQQKISFSLYELGLPETDPVYTRLPLKYYESSGVIGHYISALLPWCLDLPMFTTKFHARYGLFLLKKFFSYIIIVVLHSTL